MIVTNTFASKSNTIIEGNLANTGLNPIMQLYYGNVHTRGLIYFDESKVKSLYTDKTYPSVNHMKHTLKMWNASDLRINDITKRFPNSELTGYRERAASFDLILMKVPNEWDGGKGFDFKEIKTREGYRAYSEYGSNWYNATTDTKWECPGVYSSDFIETEMEKEESDYIIARQHFDFGNENVEMDITDYFNSVISGDETNNGFLLLFSTTLESKRTDYSQYAGFFTGHTNTFFEPYIQTVYDEHIEDDRASFFLDKPNRLYFYSTVGGNYENLDSVPSCTLGSNGRTYVAIQQTKGVYYVNCRINSSSTVVPTSYTDTWKNVTFGGNTFPEVPLKYTTMPKDGYYNFGLPFDTAREPRYKVTLSGINEGEKVPQGEIRRLVAHVTAEYTSGQEALGASVEYRVYAKFDNKELDVIGWQPLDREYANYILPLDTSSFVPQKYYIDLRVKHGNETLTEEKSVSYEIVSKI